MDMNDIYCIRYGTNVSSSLVFCTFDKRKDMDIFFVYCYPASVLFARDANGHYLHFLITEMPASGLPSGNEMHYLSREEDRSGHPMAKDTKTIGSAYDRYLQGVTLHPFMLA
jgi:hypothetical protein